MIPEDLADIDIAYMQAVVDVFTQNEGEIVREAVKEGELTPRLIQLIDRVYGEDLRDRTIAGYQAQFVDDPSLPGFSRTPGDPIWVVEEVGAVAPGCIGVEVEIDRNPSAAGEDLDTETAFLVFRPLEVPLPEIAWQLDRMLAASADQVGQQACQE